ncbi:hypothetical protein [Agromyces laixinhei]|uniref:hypothetical protein n=1 Tax=Agromyces laixinhei TaxID=2585717 RepID=UPI0012EEADE1|nr:hypothetical protein [Agromyces laixinhei]
MLSRRQLIFTAAVGAVGASVLTQGTTLSSAQAAVTDIEDRWGVTLRGAATDPSQIAVPRSFDAAEAANARAWAGQQVQIAKAMAAIGIAYTFIYYWERSPEDIKPKAMISATSEAGRALFGDSLESVQTATGRGSQSYSWESAGIRGRVVHESGMDAAN